MNKVIFIENNEISLVKYTHDDDKEMYKCWLDIRTQKGYNFAFDLSFEEFHETDISQFHFFSSIVDKKNKSVIGAIRLSPPKDEPDLAII
ncbi:hypothetical protein [Haloimpatiens massiliensis]|uniref:hypothetical protein n=1 Tax=Haloimpatiens massiliensis TaxID=1658110 RepID=UPI000C834DF6|nr:hypothetical protein [Haloimpatiens massiliensis]